MFNRLSFSLLPLVISMLTMKGLASVCWKELKCNAKVILHWELYYTLGVHALDSLILSYSLTQLHQNHYHLTGKLNFPLSTSVDDDFFCWWNCSVKFLKFMTTCWCWVFGASSHKFTTSILFTWIGLWLLYVSHCF